MGAICTYSTSAGNGSAPGAYRIEMLDQLTPLALAGRLGLAIGMAVFMGLAFEGIYKRDEHTSPGGIRTFPMLAALGAMLYLVDVKSLLPYVAGLAAVALWLYAHLRMVPGAPGARPTLMIPTANLLAYTFGPVVLTRPAWIVVATAVIAVLLLEGREALHRLVQQVAPDEVFTLGKFLILVGIVLPLLPDHPLVSWTPITPFNVWLALVAVSTLSYVSYLLQRYLPKKSGALLPAILGGAYSSTATTVALARQQKLLGEARSEVSVGIVVASAIMYLRIDAVLALFNRRLALVLLPAMGGLFVLAALIAAWQWVRRERTVASPAEKLPAMNPLQLAAAVSFAVLFVIVAVISSWVRNAFGQPGVYALAAVAGITDIDPFVLNLGQGSIAGMSVSALGAAILIAASSNNVLKASYALVFGGARACLRPAMVLVALGAVGFGVAFLYWASNAQ